MLCCRSRRFVLVIGLAGAILGVPDLGEAKVKGRHLRFEAAPVTLTSPLPTATLHAGGTIVIAWEPLPELGRHAGFEEWEAFLSLDDGGRYPVRLTPHLDLALRSFAVTLPQLAARRARLLLRFGDERDEFEYEVPGEFEILAGRRIDATPPQLARGPGEPARPGDPNDPGVAIWVDGSRQGGATRTLVAASSGAEMGAVEPQGWLAFRYATAAPEAPQIVAAGLSADLFTGIFASTARLRSAPPRTATIEPRRSTCRQNE